MQQRFRKAAAVATAAAAGNAAAAAGHLARWEEWSGAVRKRVAAQAEGRTYRTYLRLGEAVAADRTTRPSEGSDRTPSPTTRSYIAQGDSLRDMVAKDAPRTLLAREHEQELSATEKAHIQSVARVLTALFGGRLSASQYRQGISIVVAFLLNVARSAAKASGRNEIGAAQTARDESTAFWLVCAVVEDVYPVALDSQLLLAETALTWQLLRQHIPGVADHLSTLFGDAEAAEAGFTGLFVTKFLQTLCADQFPHETACQIWDILLVSHYSSSRAEVLAPEPELVPAPEPALESVQQAPQPFAAVYVCIARTTVSASMYGDPQRGGAVTLEPGSAVEVVEQCAVTSLGCVRLRVCAVARASASRTEHGDCFVHEDCGGWISKPGTEPPGQQSCFMALEREATCAMLPQVILAFVEMHAAAITASDDLSQLLGMGGESVLTKCRQETRSVGAVMRAAKRVGLSDVVIIAHRQQCRAACLALAEAQQAEWARVRRQERLAAAQDQSSATEGEVSSSSSFGLSSSDDDSDDGSRKGYRDTKISIGDIHENGGGGEGGEGRGGGSADPMPMLATVSWYRSDQRDQRVLLHRSGAGGAGTSSWSSTREGDALGEGGASLLSLSPACVDATACIALFSGPLQLGPPREGEAKGVEGPDDLVQIDESVCLGGCLGRGRHHIKCPNYALAHQRELQLQRWRLTRRDQTAAAAAATVAASAAASLRHRLRVVAAIPPAAETPLRGGGGAGRYRGKAVVILRGTVDFITKQRHAAAAGAAAVIFVNLEHELPFLAYPPLDETAASPAAAGGGTARGGGGGGRGDDLPAVCVGRADGEALLAAVQEPILLESDAAAAAAAEVERQEEETSSLSSISSLSSPAGSSTECEVWVEIRRHASQEAVAVWQKETLEEARQQQQEMQAQREPVW
jgi:hypothetical protein